MTAAPSTLATIDRSAAAVPPFAGFCDRCDRPSYDVLCPACGVTQTLVALGHTMPVRTEAGLRCGRCQGCDTDHKHAAHALVVVETHTGDPGRYDRRAVTTCCPGLDPLLRRMAELERFARCWVEVPW